MDAKSLDRNSPVPLYVQIEDFIRHEIATGSWKPGERIPSEAALNAALGVSRMTVRGVLNGLVSDGLLQRVPGKGTFVTHQKIATLPPAYKGVREQLEQMGFATTTELDREAQEGDVLTVDLTASQNGEELPEASATGVTLTVGEESGMLDGLDEAVRGLKAGESKTFASTLIGGPFRGQEADITVTVTQVAEEELPALDDEFAQLISEFDTVEEMREDLSKAVLAQAKAEQVAEARDKILEAALAQVDFEVPVDVLARELEARRNQISDQLARAGLTVETYLEQAEDEDAEDADAFWAQVDERSTQALRAQLLLDKYVDDNEVPVSQQEFTELILRRATEQRTTPQEVVNHMMEHNHMFEWQQEIRRGKALAAICEAAKVTDSEGEPVEMTPQAPEADEETETPETEEAEAQEASGTEETGSEETPEAEKSE